MNLSPPIDVLWGLFTDELCQSMYASESLITRTRRTMAQFFHMGQELANDLWRKIIDGQPIDFFPAFSAT